MNAWTVGSSSEYWHDAELLGEALEFTTRRHHEFLERLREYDENEGEDADGA